MTERTTDDKALNPAEMDTLKQAGYLPMGGGVVGKQILVRFAHERSVYSATRAQWRIIIAELAKSPMTERTMEIMVAFTEDATDAVVTIQRKGETFQETVNRILETLLPTAPDFDEFYGEPRDGKGPSGTY